MDTNIRRTRIFARLGIIAWCFVPSLSAQPSRLAPRASSQIVGQVIGAVIPPGDSLSRVSADNREIFFDQERMLVAFGYRNAQVAISELALRSSARSGR